MTQSIRCQALVIGAGPAGTAAGISLARRGIDVCVVDRARFPRAKTCGDALSSAAVRLVEKLGARDRFDRAAQASVRGAAAIFPGGQRVDCSYGARPGRIVTRTIFDHLLRQQLAVSGARVYEGLSIRTLRRGAHRFEGAEADGYRFSADVVIAADGPGSASWAALGLSYPRGSALALAITGYMSRVDFAGHQGISEHYFEHQIPFGYAWIFPAVDGLSNVGVYQRADYYKRSRWRLRTQWNQFVSRHPARFHQARLRSALRTWALPLSRGPVPPSAPGLLLCGDAGRLVDPLSGEGIWQALQSGLFAADVVANTLDNGGIDRRAVRRYQQMCARHIGWPAIGRRAIQHALHPIVSRGLYRASALRALLRWGYQSRAPQD